ncbi:helix-turn-helix domain-containing protein [uncultured Psychrobacter sp.]|uniref:helix-turn-helix domain-containing protein n=1 Tax=uncultured Psychrobacter sp. TaxID=259303 RepID=UPI00263539CD|nr:helix-turn-helix domain-containing protein [uncultured Psychrobacter sp.]
MTTSAAAPVTNEPVPKTQIEIIRAHLMTGATITIWDSISLYKITSLAPRIHELRAEGMFIQSEMVKHNNKWFAVYWLDEQTLLGSELSTKEAN